MKDFKNVVCVTKGQLVLKIQCHINTTLASATKPSGVPKAFPNFIGQEMKMAAWALEDMVFA
jgi:hypothetical protein